MSKVPIGLVNFSRKYDGVAICTDIYYNTLKTLGFSVGWYQFEDYYDTSSFMQRPTVIKGSRAPFAGFRAGYDRMIRLPSLSSVVKEDYVFLADPTLIRLGLKKKGFMVKVHDLIPLSKYRDLLSSWAMFRYAIPRINNASTIIVTTSYMKNQLAGYVEDSDKIFVVADPVGFEPDPKHIEDSKIRVESGLFNVLYIAADRPYKNIRMYIDLAKQFDTLGLKGFSFTLVSALKESTKAYLESQNLTNLRILSHVPDLSGVFGESDVIVNTSLQEGFGRPIVEGMAHGMPVVARKMEPFREIIGNDSTLMDDYSLMSWVETIIKLAEKKRYEQTANDFLKRFESTYSNEIFHSRLKIAFDFFLERIQSREAN